MNIAHYNSVVPANIRRILKERCCNQRAVAEKAGYSRQQFCDMLQCRKLIKPCDIVAIADALGVEAGDLFAKE